jgi:hypothetical protein
MISNSRPGEHLRHGGDDRRNQPDGGGQQQHAEGLLDRLHPRPGLGQQRASREADGDQRHAHAERHDKQRRAAEHGIAGLADVEQRAGQRRGDAGADDQRRQAPIRKTPGSPARPAGGRLLRTICFAAKVGNCNS